MRQPSLEEDFWELESGEARHAASPDSFWIPDRVAREALQPGSAVKLLFRIQIEQPDGSVDVGVERMWVFVTERLADGFIGVLDNQPGSFPPDDDVYLVVGAEIPFAAEHVIDIGHPPAEYVEAMKTEVPTRQWPRA